ncbi:60S ribosomal protein L6-like [Oppia nitens]|uniref:60S ribosomal protein L6-like n=1 Tax=Oppia nitens TaxID=1686743 RepID=UPI0023DAB9BD|nr:60S ribosomal protein L6-like [Oppia nitens]
MAGKDATKAKAAPKAAAAAPAKKPTTTAAAKSTKKTPKRVLPKNVRKLVTHRSTRPLWAKIRRTAKRKGVPAETLLKKKPKFVVKKIGGEKNGGKRKVLVKKGKKYYPTEETPKKSRTGHKIFAKHKRTLKAGLVPGSVLIVLAGRHRGKRVVFLKQLASGLLLVTGPYKINACPLRRMHQQFVIVTSTRLDVSAVKVPDHIDDKYFKVKKDRSPKGKRGDGGDIFDTKAEGWKPDEKRKADQIAVDKQIIDVVRKNKDKKLLLAYLGSYFQLRNRVFPHKLKF